MDYLHISIDEEMDATENRLVNLDDSTNKVKLLIDLDSNGNSVAFSQIVEETELINGVTELLKSYISQNNNNMPSISNIDEFELKSISVNFQKKE